MARPAVFLDRDGVLTIPEFRCGRSFAPLSLDAFALFPDATESVARLKAAGFLVIVATNQPDVTTGRLDPAVLDAMHRRLRAEVPVDGIEVSIATRANPDRRRKPAPGMVLDAAAEWDIDLAGSYFVGDRDSDVACGRAAGCRTVFVDHGYTAELVPADPDTTVGSLSQAVDWICADHERLSGTRNEPGQP